MLGVFLDMADSGLAMVCQYSGHVHPDALHTAASGKMCCVVTASHATHKAATQHELWDHFQAST